MTDQTNNAVEVSCDNQPGVIRICRDGENDHTLVIHNSVHVHYCDDGCGSASNSCDNGDGSGNPTDGGSDNPSDGGTDPGTSTGDTNAADPDHAVGNAGGPGFGVGIYPDPDTLPTELTPMDGYDQLGHDNYGNYQAQDGSIMVFVPRFYYRIGSNQSANWATYGSNAIDIAGLNTFATTAAANAEGYVLHRTFIDGGEEKYGFFIDKFLNSASEDGTRSLSVTDKAILTTGNGNPPNGTVSMLNDNNATPRDGFRLAAYRAEQSNLASIFMHSALSMLVMAHVQASVDNSQCAWLDIAGGASQPQPRVVNSTTLDLTTHNGQNSGIADLNSGDEAMLGVTKSIEGGSDSEPWMLKPEVSFGDLLPYEGGPNDLWGNRRHLASLYDSFAHTNIGLGKWGNADNAMLSGDQTGAGYISDSLFVPVNASAISADGLPWMSNKVVGFDDTNGVMCPLKTDTYGISFYYRIDQQIATRFRAALYAA